MNHILESVAALSDYLWKGPMLFLIVGCGIFLTIRLGFFQIRYYPYIIKQTFGSMFQKKVGQGTVSPFEAATTALASTVGASNIVGVPIAIAFGGPGAVFWMWVVSIIGCATKFSEIVLGMKYREVNGDGQYVGGPMYYLYKGIPFKSLGSFLSVMYAFFTLFLMFASIAVQSVAATQTIEVLGISKITSGLLLTIFIGIISYGGITRIAGVTSKLVPVMAAIYILGALFVICANITELPHVFSLILRSAFTPSSAVGGVAGFSVASAMRYGIARGTYSCEAGMGSAPVAHSAAATDHPVRQGFWGVFEVTVSSLIICTLSALVVLTTGVWTETTPSAAASMPTLAFQAVLGDAAGGLIVSVSMLLFVISTLIVQVFYGEKQWEFFVGTRVAKFMKIFYVLMIMVGAVGGIELIFGFLDIILAVTVFPNMIGLILMSGQVVSLKKEFFSNPKYYR